MADLVLDHSNKIIAEFMGKRFYTIKEWNDVYGTKDEPSGCDGLSFVICGYYNSLDNLTPVWKKLGVDFLNCAINCYTDDIGQYVNFKIFINEQKEKVGNGNAQTVQAAACIATAAAIGEMRNDR